MDVMTTSLLTGNEAHNLLFDEVFQMKWLHLFDQCEYATVFQHPSFVQTWYDTYKQQWVPVVVKYETEENVLNGLWLLAYSPEKKKLVHAGAHQSEYHVWLAKTGEEPKFVANAWKLLKKNFDFEELHFKYLPCSMLCGAFSQIKSEKNCVIQRKFKRPIQEINTESIESLFSKRNKQRIKRLAGLGKLEFKRITDQNEFNQVFPQLSELYDYRMGAVNDVIPFSDDKWKGQFYSNLFKKDKDSFIVGVTYLDNQPIAGSLSGITKGTVHLYMGMHSPVYNMHSPGITHMLQFCEYIYRMNLNRMDLTPGGDSWKNRFATSYDEVVYAVLYKSRMRREHSEIKHFLKDNTKKILQKIGVDAEGLREIAKHKHHKIKVLTTIAKENKWNYLDFKIDLYESTHELKLNQAINSELEVKLNSLNNLLAFSPDGAVISRKKFLSLTNSLFEKGAESYSIKQGNELLASVWTLQNQSTFKINKNQTEVLLSKKGTVLFNFYINYRLLNENTTVEIISKIINTLIEKDEERHFFAFVDSKNLAVSNALKAINFQYKNSYSKELSHLWQN